MAANFDDLIKAQLNGHVVRCNTLVKFDFLSGAKFYWQGFGDLNSGGHIWKGLGNLGQISSSSAGPAMAVEEMTFLLATDKEALGHFTEDAEEVTGREVEVFFQFFDIRTFDEAGKWVDWKPINDPFIFFWGIMGPLKVQRPVSSSNPSEARASRTLSVTASNALINRGRPAYGYYSHRDQQARYPGDNIFINITAMADAKVHWPDFTV